MNNYPKIVGTVNIGCNQFEYVIEKMKDRHKLSYPFAMFLVYNTLDDLKITEQVVPYMNELLRFYLFGDLIFEKVAPPKILEKANKKAWETKVHLLENSTMPVRDEKSLTKWSKLLTDLNEIQRIFR